MNIPSRLAALRKLMKKHNIQAYIIPGADAHQSEYAPELWQRRAWISGFNGSAGEVVVTLDKAGLWTDSRYFLQAETQLQGSGIELFKIGLPDSVSMNAFLIRELKPGEKVGVDPRLLGHNAAHAMRNELLAAKIKLEYLEENLIDEIWDDQPSMPADKIMVHLLRYAGESVDNKLQRIRERMKTEGCAVHVLTTLDAIAWTFNIRGRDIAFNPLVISYAIITLEKAELFLTPRPNMTALRRHLSGLAEIHKYTAFRKRLLKNCPKKSRVWLDGGSVNEWIVSLLKKRCELHFKDSPVTLFKARKNATEMEGFYNCHIRDGAAMVRFFKWLEDSVPGGNVTELSAAAQAEDFRREQDFFVGASFSTISSYGENGAVIHRSPTKDDNALLKPEGIFLFDSGAQYLDGTTDITRTVALGEPTAEQKDRFTRVLKGHIAIAACSFPRGAQGWQIDVLARKALWDIGLNFGHGVGHGIGSFLSVHEGPQAISYYRGFGYALEPGMLLSNEPGFYKPGEYGMRVENLICVVKDEEKSGAGQEFYKFETATLCPIDLKLVDKSLLTRQEMDYLNHYHKRCYKTLSPLLKKDEKVWLKNATRPI